MYIKRNLEETILKHLKSREIIAVLGPRQAGKTSMISQIFKDLKGAKSITFEDQRTLTLFEKNIDDFIALHVRGNTYLFIDEFQYANSGGKLLKYIYDTQRIKIVISGSSVVDLTIRAVRHLVGRILIFQLYPFDFREYLSAVDTSARALFDEYQKRIDLIHPHPLQLSQHVHGLLSKHFMEYILFGGYPRVVLEEDRETKKTLLANIYNTYFLREVRDILGLVDDYKLSNLLRGLALGIGNLLEYNELSRLSGYSFVAVKKYINFFEKTYLCWLIRPYHTNKRTEIVKNPKAYFFDTGLRNSVVNDFRPFDQRPDAGALLENGIAMQAVKKNYFLNFWRDKKKHEVDFIISLGEDRRAAVESKHYAIASNMRTFSHLQTFYPSLSTILSYYDADEYVKKAEGAYPIYFI